MGKIKATDGNSHAIVRANLDHMRAGGGKIDEASDDRGDEIPVFLV